jgi:thiamine pyrophosphokinase
VTLRAVIFANGELASPEFAKASVMADDLIIAADGGLRHVFKLGLVPKILIGDLDSAPSELVQLARNRGADIRRHPAEKDQTDLELALDAAREAGATEIRIFAAAGGRIDHALANILSLANYTLAGIQLRMVDEEYEVAVVSDELHIVGRPGDIVSLLALSDRVTGITTHGLKYALTNGAIVRGSSLGVSNEMLTDRASLTLESGLLLVMRVSAYIDHE